MGMDLIAIRERCAEIAALLAEIDRLKGEVASLRDALQDQERREQRYREEYLMIADRTARHKEREERRHGA